MKRSLLVVLSLWMLGATAASGADSKRIPDLVYFDGFAWNRIERINSEWAPTFKAFLVRGIYESAYTVNPQLFTERFNNDVGYRELVMTLDEFYTDEHNLKTPVTYAIMIVMKVPDKIPKRSTDVLVSKEDSSQ